MRCTEGVVISYNEGTIYSVDDNTYYVSAYNGTASTVSLPYYYDDGVHGVQAVKAIGPKAFADHTVMTELIVPSTIMRVAYDAF